MAEVADAVVDEHARLQEGRHGGRHGGGGNGRRGGARRVLVDDKVVGGGGGGRVAAAEKAREGRREAGSDGASDSSGEHLFSPSSLLSNGEAAVLGFTFFLCFCFVFSSVSQRPALPAYHHNSEKKTSRCFFVRASLETLFSQEFFIFSREISSFFFRKLEILWKNL
jgi:hypothetical protein